jgi:hypothetical protein
VTPGEFSGADQVPGELDVGFVSHMDAHPTIMTHMGHQTEQVWGLDGAARGLD